MPYIYLSDATQGVHMRDNLSDPTMVRQLERSTAFPCPISLAATFNPSLAYRYAEAVGEECRAGGIEVLLGPGMNNLPATRRTDATSNTWAKIRCSPRRWSPSM